MARLGLGCCGLVLAALLCVAARLEPNPRGYGTHQQLGLWPCSFVMLTGLRCPACGMTTSWAHAVRGDWMAAVRVNSGGALLAAVSMMGAPLALLMACGGRWLLGQGSTWPTALAAAIVAVTLFDWYFRLRAG